MAEFWSNNDRGYRIRLWLDQGAQNTEGNSSQLRVQLALLNTTSTFAQYGCSAFVEVNGQRLNWSGTPSVLSYNQTVQLIDQTITVNHNQDGTKSVTVSAGFNGSGGYSPGNLSIQGVTFTFTPFTRASSVTSTSAFSVEIGDTLNLTLSRANTSYTHTLSYRWGSRRGEIARNVQTSYKWLIPKDFASEIPESTGGVGTLIIDTYNGGTKVGTQEINFTALVPEDVKPSLSSITLEDTNQTVKGLLSGNNFLQVISNIRVFFTGQAGAYGSKITGYRAEIVNKNQVTTQDGGALGVLNFTGSATIRASVCDSRGRWSTPKDVTINVLEYFAPVLSFSAVRTRENPNTIQVVRNVAVAPINQGGQKNLLNLKFKVAPLNTNDYKKDVENTYTTVASLTNSAVNLTGYYPSNRSYVIVGTVSDRFTSTEFSAVVGTESVVMSYDKDGRVGVGKVVEYGKQGSLDVRGDIYAGGKKQRFIDGGLTDKSPNELTTTGAYMLSNKRDLPAAEWGQLLTIKGAHDEGNTMSQFYMPFTESAVYVRNVHGVGQTHQTWQPWVRLVDERRLVNYAALNEKASFSELSVTTTKKKTIAFPYGLQAYASRKGNTVTLTLQRDLKAIASNTEYSRMDESIPFGWRPIDEVTMTLTGNNYGNVDSFALLHLKGDGTILLTNSRTVSRVWTGSITYLTNDPIS